MAKVEILPRKHKTSFPSVCYKEIISENPKSIDKLYPQISRISPYTGN